MQLCHFPPANDVALFPEMDSSSKKKILVIFLKAAVGPALLTQPNCNIIHQQIMMKFLG